MSQKNSSDTIENWTRDLRAYSGVPKPTALQRASNWMYVLLKISLNSHATVCDSFLRQTRIGNEGKFCKQELHEWRSSVNVVMGIESKKRWWVGCGVCIGRARNPYEISVTKPKCRYHCGDLGGGTKLMSYSLHHAATSNSRFSCLDHWSTIPLNICWTFWINLSYRWPPAQYTSLLWIQNRNKTWTFI
jgi:hypothetical protein